MAKTLVFRDATMSDAETLLAWRNDPQTRANSRNTEMVSAAEHRQWLQRVLSDKNRTLLIAEQSGSPIGTLRVDDEGDECEMSWTVAPEFRHRGLGAAMVSSYLPSIAKPVKAEIRSANLASISIAKKSGFSLVEETEHFQTWALKPSGGMNGYKPD